MLSRPNIWPQSVNELIPNTLFKLASRYPDLTYAEYSRTNNAADGNRKITFKEVANAAHAVAWWIEKHVGKPAKDDGSETLVYMGPNDLRYGLLIFGSVLVGYKMLFPTPRYGAESITALISCVNSSVMLAPASPSPVVAEVLSKHPMRSFEIPSLEELLESETAAYAWTKTFETNKYEPLVCLHTSGTTGFPKPVIWTHDWANSAAQGHYISAPSGYELIDDILQGPQRRVMTLFPPMHASGVICALIFPLFRGTVVVHGPNRLTPIDAVDAAVDALELLDAEDKINVLALPPPHAEYLAANSALLDRTASRVETIMWAGGSLSHAAGATIETKHQLLNVLASTEMGIWPAIRQVNMDTTNVVHDEYQYITFHPSLNIRFDPVSASEEGILHEAILVRNDGQGAWTQPIFKIFTKAKEMTLGDMFIQHPHDPQKWKYSGRADDLLVFIDTMKFYPGLAEQQIMAHSGVAEALIVGTRRPKASLIIRLEDSADIEDVRTMVENVTKDYPVYARIKRYMILTVTEPFQRTAKGTIMKRATTDLYERQLNALYDRTE